MINGHYFKYFSFALLLTSHVATAQNITIKITDLSGNPLEDAVVEVIGNTKPELTHREAVIDQVNKHFKPEVILVHEGDRVKFPNSDNIRHQVYSFSKAKSFELKLYANTPKAPVEFDNPGIVVLGCNIHDSMVGYIYVAAFSEAKMTNNDGVVTLDLHSKKEQFRIWYKNQKLDPEKTETVTLNQANSKNTNGYYVFKIATMPPPPRDTFEDKFHEDSAK